MYSFSTRVRYSEVDASLQLSYPAIINYFQDCSIFHSEDLGIGIDYLQQEHRVWLMNSWQIQILRFPSYGEEITVNTWPYEFKSMFGYRNFTMTDNCGTPLVIANSIWVFTDTATGRPIRPDPVYASRYPLEPPYPMEYAPRKIDLPAKGTALSPIPVTLSHLDSNRHVNNGQYVAMAATLLSDKDYNHLRVEYKKSAQLGDIIYPRISHTEAMCTIVLASEDGTPYAIAEFKK
ncbi:MAG: thioesterase [Lachnospiraceae bacterium]|nr:thioesterase [Lachnospiraceae bacterium]